MEAAAADTAAPAVPQWQQYRLSWWGSGHIKRGGGRLEMFKFFIYISIPITASFFYNSPSMQHWLVGLCQYIIYPAESQEKPPSGEEILDKLKREREAKKAAKMMALESESAVAASTEKKKRFWLF